MSNEQTPVEPVTDDLDAFSDELFGQSKSDSEPSSSEDIEEVVEESDAKEDTHADADDTSAPDDDEETEEAVDDNPKPKKNRTQERIVGLNSQLRETERKLAEAIARIEAQEKPEPKPATEAVGEPKPTDVNADGTDKYPLGEFDPTYIKDLMRHTLAEDSKVRDEKLKVSTEEAKAAEAQASLEASWNEKLAPAQERYPDFQDKIADLQPALGNIEEGYGTYLQNLFMDMEHGPDVLYYLANNPEEAVKIVESGATRATIALGRIEARFLEDNEEKPNARPKVSSAPPPPPRNKGSAASVEVPDDTDDLDAFAAKLFSKRRT